MGNTGTVGAISKIFHDAWFPLVIGAAFFTLMLTWVKGRGANTKTDTSFKIHP